MKKNSILNFWILSSFIFILFITPAFAIAVTPTNIILDKEKTITVINPSTTTTKVTFESVKGMINLPEEITLKANEQKNILLKQPLFAKGEDAIIIREQGNTIAGGIAVKTEIVAKYSSTILWIGAGIITITALLISTVTIKLLKKNNAEMKI